MNDALMPPYNVELWRAGSCTSRCFCVYFSELRSVGPITLCD